METIIKQLAVKIKDDLVHDMRNEQNGDDITMLVLAAYNRYQEDERDGVDYIFNLNNADDLKCCIDGGMHANEIASIYYNHKAHKHTTYFLFGQNYEQPEIFQTWDALKTYLTNFLDSIIKYMLVYHNTDGYRQLYDHCISGYIINNNLV